MTDYTLKLPSELNGFRGPSRSENPLGVYKVEIPQLPELLFEYHPVQNRVFAIVKNSKPQVYEAVADCGDVQQARTAVLMWARGYIFGTRNRLIKS